MLRRVAEPVFAVQIETKKIHRLCSINQRVTAPKTLNVGTLLTFDLNEVTAAVSQAIAMGAVGFDAVKHLVLCRIEHKPPRLNLEFYPYLPRAEVRATQARTYLSLLKGAAA